MGASEMSLRYAKQAADVFICQAVQHDSVFPTPQNEMQVETPFKSPR